MILVGVALSLLKGTELLLSSGQRAAVQNAFDAIAIAVDDDDIEQLSQELRTPHAQLVFVITYFEFLLVITLAAIVIFIRFGAFRAAAAAEVRR
jgi:hypothetical protein